MISDIHVLASSQCDVGESPVWSSHKQTVYWVDISAGLVWGHSLTDQATSNWQVGDMCAGLACTDHPDRLLVGTDRGIMLLDTATGVVSSYIETDWKAQGLTPNEGKTGPDGTFWIGTTSGDSRTGTLSAIKSGHIKTVLTKLGLPNTMAWNQAQDLFYFGDSSRAVIHRYQWQGAENPPIRQDEFYSTKEEDGVVPDGSAIDQDDCLWTAHWGGGRVSHLAADGTQLAVASMPVSQVTSCCFGGHELNTLFITSARYGLGDKESQAGNLFAVTVGTKGQPIPDYHL